MDSPLNDIRIGQVTSQWAEGAHIFTRYSKETESTNTTAKAEAFEEDLLEESLCLYVTDHQTAGRGRGQNKWTGARPGSALLTSWSFMAGEKPQPTTSCLIGLAVYRACQTTWPYLAWNLKAPNDLYIGNKKVAGILLENVIQGDEVRLVVGLGMNITDSPSEVDIATSVVESLPKGIPLLGQDFTAFLDRLLFEMTDAVSHCEDPLTATDRLSLLMALNQHPLLEEKYTGMKADGSLVIGDRQIHWAEL